MTLSTEIVSNPFGDNKVIMPAIGALADQSRAIAEIEAQMIIAKKFPRNPMAAMEKIINACTRKTLAEAATYSYVRGGTEITGATIRLAEAIAQAWGNLDFGIMELGQEDNCSIVVAYCLDLESNIRNRMQYKVPHTRYSKKSGNKKLEDPRDIYEMIANQGARRMRACILRTIPGDVVETALHQCEVTLRTTVDLSPERIKSMLEKFFELGVTQAMIEKRLQRHVETINPAQMIQLGKIYNSITSGMSTAQTWFEEEKKETEKNDESTAQKIMHQLNKHKNLKSLKEKNEIIDAKVNELEEIRQVQLSEKDNEETNNI